MARFVDVYQTGYYRIGIGVFRFRLTKRAQSAQRRERVDTLNAYHGVAVVKRDENGATSKMFAFVKRHGPNGSILALPNHVDSLGGCAYVSLTGTLPIG